MNKLRKRVLIVDDDLMMREALRLILHSENYKIVGEAGDGEAAINLFTTLRPDLVLLDINMPKMDGLQALEKMRDIYAPAKIMMVSTESKMSKVQEAIQHGASGFIVKPLSSGNVLDRVEKCFK